MRFLAALICATTLVTGSAHANNTPGQVFQDCALCPQMIAVPPGKFLMGDEEGRLDATPIRQVALNKPFAVGIFEVTRQEFGAFVAATNYRQSGGCTYFDETDERLGLLNGWFDPGFPQEGDHPVACVNWHEAQGYVSWLSDLTGERYRLLSEAEWEYVARAGSVTPFSCGEDKACLDKIAWHGTNDIVVWADIQAFTHAVGTKQPNAFGLYDAQGNVSEWVQDCYHKNYIGAPTDGSSWEGSKSCHRVQRGGAWGSPASFLTSSFRMSGPASKRANLLGFRVAREL